jgi:tRNA dimethylallyltransferase
MKQVIIIGPTASGKSALAVDIARHTKGVILSVDSLSIYKEFTIVAAKPTIEEQGGIEHFGIDVLEPTDHFSVGKFFFLYEEAYRYAEQNNLPLIIVGGTGFYIKMLLEGLPSTPMIDVDVEKKIAKLMDHPLESFLLLEKIDPEYTKNIEKSDLYRISRGLSWYYQTSLIPSLIGSDKSTPLKGEAIVFEIEIDRETLGERIAHRTKEMIKNGLIDEIAKLEKNYSRNLQPMRSIGVREVLQFFDGEITKSELQELITIHTRQLAKRQQTFNKTQLKEKITTTRDQIYESALAYLV